MFQSRHPFSMVLIIGLMIFSGLALAQSESDEPLYRDAGQPIHVRVADLLSRMTLEEKIGQLNMPCVYESGLGPDIPAKMENCKKFAAGTLIPEIGPGGGFFTLANTILHEGPLQQVNYFNELQKIAREQTRLGIPLLQTEEGTHGLMCSGGTIFPEGLALGSTWNLDLLHQIYEVVAREGRGVGIHQLFTLVIEPYRDARLGRNQEGYSEDPYYTARIAEIIVDAVQGNDLTAGDKAVAGFCHYPGQSQPVSGLERGAMEISERMLREVFLPPWEAGIKKGGALGVMATYPAIDGVPVHGSSWILTEILRHELGFKGLVLSEGGGIETLVYEGLAPTQKEAGQLALKAGVDVGISYEDGYLKYMLESVREGLVSEETVDRSVARILELKFRLGLFEQPFVKADESKLNTGGKSDRKLALEAARQGIVLLKNEGNLLPLKKDLKSIAVIGPNADHRRNQLGDYTSASILQEVVTVLAGIRGAVSESTQVSYVRGCDVIDESWNEIDKAAEIARQSEVAVVVLGENEWQAEGKQGTSGEAFDVASLDLTGLQLDLVQAVVETGTPTVVVLINGRPLSTRWVAENVPAVLEAWSPGEEGGTAVSEILFGDVNPSGRLPVTIPRHVGQLPVYYNFKKSKSYWIKEGWGKPYADMSPEPLYEFGFGLSYTTFEYSDLSIEPAMIGPAGRVKVSLKVKNTGSREGTEVVQLYVEDLIATVSTSVQEMRGFRRVELQPGQVQTVTFELGPQDLELLDRHLERVVEPGEFKVMVGHSSRDVRLSGTFEVK
ncbi:MAG: glycoside hydrolase family 3 C-terminal domain-containing protein [Acidobacteriota bacterium]|nr:MAG: glycoside hydrolase family 3 C-terminal domain-containing protein [Acidobacteriota bacterium]